MAKKFDLKRIKKGPKKNLLEKEEANGQKEEEEAEEKAKTKSKKKSLGRPKKEKSELLSKKVTVNFTETEEKALKKLSKKYLDAPLPKLVRALLKDNKII